MAGSSGRAPSRFQVDDQFECRRLLDRQIGGFRTFEDLIDKDGKPPVNRGIIHSITEQHPRLDPAGGPVPRRAGDGAKRARRCRRASRWFSVRRARNRHLHRLPSSRQSAAAGLERCRRQLEAARRPRARRRFRAPSSAARETSYPAAAARRFCLPAARPPSTVEAASQPGPAPWSRGRSRCRPAAPSWRRGRYVGRAADVTIGIVEVAWRAARAAERAEGDDDVDFMPQPIRRHPPPAAPDRHRQSDPRSRMFLPSIQPSERIPSRNSPPANLPVTVSAEP